MLRFHEQSVDSTNTRAAALAATHPDAPLAVSADIQVAGRGRSGRPWRSPSGGAWFSVAWPTAVSPIHAEAAPLVAGLAVIESLAELLDDPRRLTLKWPNDVLLDGGKVAGILCERTLRTDGAGGHTIVVGVGINANMPAAALGTDLRHRATSLADALGHPVGIAPLIDACVARLAEGLGRLLDRGFAATDAAAVNARLAWRGEAIILRHGDTAVEGVIEGVDARGRLTLDVDGVAVVFHAGEVQHVRQAAAAGERGLDTIHPTNSGVCSTSTAGCCP